MLRSDRYIRHVTPFVAHSRFGAAMIWQKLSCCPTSKCVGIFSVSERRFYTTEGAKAADSSTQCATPSSTASTSVINIKSTEEYQKLVLEASKTKPIIVDCYADWCKPCKALAPLIETVVKGLDGKVTLAKVNIDNLSEVAVQLSVSSIPALFAIYKKETVSKVVGLKTRSELEDFMNAVLKKAQV